MSEQNVEESKKRAYSTPALVAYGSVAKLTQGSATNGADGVNSFMNMACL